MRRVVSKAAVSGLILALLMVFVTPVSAVVDEPDVDSSADYTYVINPEAGVVEVRIELEVIADKPNRTTSNGTFRYYFSGYRLLIPHEAENLRVTNDRGVELAHEREATEEELSDVLSVEFTGYIYYRQRARLVIEFSLSAGTAGSDNIVRINPAYASFSAWTSPLLEQATVTIELPAGYDDRSRGATTFAVEADQVGQRLIAADVDPESYYSLVSVVNDDALEVDVIDLAGTIALADESARSTIRVRSWPGDDGWRNYVVNGVEETVPTLVELIGQPWPIEEDLTITESFTPYLDGYAGWYNTETDVIEVGDEQNEHVLAHELAHVWFHPELFAHRWITEGLADLYAAEAIAIRSGERSSPPEVSRTDPAAIPLDHFDRVSQPDEERWAYAASWFLMEEIVEDIGLDGMAAVIESAQKRELSYPGDGEPETVRSAADWHRFLDLVENLQGVDQGPTTDLIQEWVLSDEGVGRSNNKLIEDRGRARARYFDLAEQGDRWAMPLAVRNAMMFWQFAKADDLLDDAERILDDRDELLDTIAPTGATLPSEIEVLYETDDRAFDEAFLAAVEAGNELREASDLASAGHSVIERIGLIGTDLEGETSDAVAAFNTSHMDRAIKEANQVDRLVGDAAETGQLRLAISTAIVALLLAAVWVLGFRPRPVPSSPSPQAPGGDGS